MHLGSKYSPIQRRKKSCKEKLWKLRSRKFLGTQVGNFVCNAMPDEIWEMLKANFGAILGFSAFSTISPSPALCIPCFLHLPQNLWFVKQSDAASPRIEKNSSILEPLQGQQQREFCFGCWVLWQCRIRIAGQSVPLTPQLLTVNICHSHYNHHDITITSQ